MKTRILFVLVAIFIAIACEKEVNIYVPEDKPCVHTDTTIIYESGDIRVESFETDLPTDSCQNGQIHFMVYKDDVLIHNEIRCKDGYSCEEDWEYVEFNEEGACDTLYRYDCDGNLDVAIPYCKPGVIILPGDTVVVRDTVTVTLPGDTVHVYDTIQITDELAYVIFPLLYEDCDKGSSGFYHNELNWTVLETGFSINPYFDNGSVNKHGAIVFYDKNKSLGIVWTHYLSSPECIGELPNLYAAWLYSGSRIESEQQIWAMYEDGSIEKIKSGTTKITSDFEWSKHYDDKTWDKENLFMFKEDDLRNPKAPKIIKVGIGYKKTSDNSIFCRNDKYNADELHVWGYKLINNKRK